MVLVRLGVTVSITTFWAKADEFLSVRPLLATRFFVRKGRRFEALKTAALKQWKIFYIELSAPLQTLQNRLTSVSKADI